MTDKEEYRTKTLIANGHYLKELDNYIYNYIKTEMKVTDIASHIDAKIRKDGYVADPVSIELDYFVRDCSPMEAKIVTENSKVSWTVTIYRKKEDKFRAKISMANTKSLGYTKIYDHLNVISYKVINMCKVGVLMSKLSKCVEDSFKEFKDDDITGLKTITNEYSRYEGNIYEKKCYTDFTNVDFYKIFGPTKVQYNREMNKFIDGKVLKEGDIFFIDLYATNLSDHEMSRVFESYPTMCVLREPQKTAKDLINKANKNKPAKSQYDLMCKYMNNVYNKTFSLREFSKYMTKMKRTFNISLIEPFYGCGLIEPVGAMYIEQYHDEKKKEYMEIQENIKKTDDENIISELKKKQQALLVNEAKSIHIGRTILVGKDKSIILC